MSEIPNGRIELSQREFIEKFQQARDVVAETFTTSRPLIELGYNSGQCRTINNLLEELYSGDAAGIERNVTRTRHKLNQLAEFRTDTGRLYFSFNANTEFILTGNIDVMVSMRDNFPRHSIHPQIYGFVNNTSEHLTIGEVMFQIYGKEANAQPIDFSKSLLQKVPGLKEVPKLKYAYQAYYLDERTKKDIAVYFPADEKNSYVLRSLLKNDTHEVYGIRVNVEPRDMQKVRSLQLQAGRVLNGSAA